MLPNQTNTANQSADNCSTHLQWRQSTVETRTRKKTNKNKGSLAPQENITKRKQKNNVPGLGQKVGGGWWVVGGGRGQEKGNGIQSGNLWPTRPSEREKKRERKKERKKDRDRESERERESVNTQSHTGSYRFTTRAPSENRLHQQQQQQQPPPPPPPTTTTTTSSANKTQ